MTIITEKQRSQKDLQKEATFGVQFVSPREFRPRVGVTLQSPARLYVCGGAFGALAPSAERIPLVKGNFGEAVPFFLGTQNGRSPCGCVCLRGPTKWSFSLWFSSSKTTKWGRSIPLVWRMRERLGVVSIHVTIADALNLENLCPYQECSSTFHPTPSRPF